MAGTCPGQVQVQLCPQVHFVTQASFPSISSTGEVEEWIVFIRIMDEDLLWYEDH